MPPTVTIRRETKHRGGKQVTAIAGLAFLGDAGLRALASELKRRCASGGTAAGGTIELQGDHRDAVQEVLERRGYVVKRAGG